MPRTKLAAYYDQVVNLWCCGKAIGNADEGVGSFVGLLNGCIFVRTADVNMGFMDKITWTVSRYH